MLRIVFPLLLVLWAVAAWAQPVPPVLEDEPEAALNGPLPPPEPTLDQLWAWEPRPEYGAGSAAGTGIEFAAWKLGRWRVALNFGLHDQARTQLEMLREDESASDFPLLRVDPEALVAGAENEGLDPAGRAYDLLSWQRFVYLIVTF